MVNLEQTRASNSRIASDLPPGLVAVFVGGTGAIGRLTMLQLAKYAVKPKIYFIGRSQAAGDRLTAQLKELNTEGEYTFIPTDVSLLRNVDEVCREIKSKERYINILFLTLGNLEPKGKSGKLTAIQISRLADLRITDTEEGISAQIATMYYARIRFIANLLPLIQRAPSLRRVVSVLCGTKEGEVNLQDLPGRTVSLLQMRSHFGSMTTLALESLALEAPDVSFVHDFPGTVKSDIGSDSDKLALVALRLILKVVGPLVYIPDVEVGDRHLYLATSARFPPKLSADGVEAAGVSIPNDIKVSIGSNGDRGSGVYSVNYDGEPPSPKVLKVLMQLRADDVVRKVWQHTEDVFTGVTGATFV